MTNNRKTVWTLLICFTIVAGISFSSINASAHAPNFVDMKYYAQDEILSVYITHGVSDYDYHYVDTVIIDFYELPESLIDDFKENNVLEARDPGDQEVEESIFSKIAIQEADVFDVFSLEDNIPTNTTIYNYDSQATHQVFHNNYSIYIPEWTLIVVTAVCRLEGNYSVALVSGHPWYDPEHSILEAAVPTVIMSIIVMTPLALLRIFGKKPEEVKH